VQRSKGGHGQTIECDQANGMKKIEAIIRLSKLHEVQNALDEIGIDGMTVCEVKGFGRQNRHTETYRGSDYTVNFLPKIKIDLVVGEQRAEQALKVIINAAKSSDVGDDKVFISNIEEARYALAI
jgi:nitrogen regulatory protein PII